MKKRSAATIMTLFLTLVTVLGLSAERVIAAPVEAEMVNDATCKKDVRTDTTAFESVTEAEAGVVEVLFRVRPTMKTSAVVVDGTYDRIVSRYYEAKVTKQKTTYRCVAERVLKDGRFGEPSHRFVEWYDGKGKGELTVTSYYEVLDSERPLAGITLFVGAYTVSLSSNDASTIGPLENWQEIDLAILSVKMQNATKKLAADTARNFVLTNYLVGEPEVVDISTGYVIGLEQSGVTVMVTPAEAASVQQRLLLKNSTGSLLRSREERVLHHYSDFYFFPSLGWGGGHITTRTEKHWVGELFTTEKGKFVGSHFMLVEVSPSNSTSDYWFTGKGIVR
ncbi:MAG: hypothetical protein WC052_01090 [Patescibacteria group bacterium]